MPTESQFSIADIDFDTLQADPNFKEDSVREIIIVPMLYALGYSDENIVRSKTLKDPYVKVGTKRQRLSMIPDYALRIDDKYAFVLDAKSPRQHVVNNDNVLQAYSYAIHPEIRSLYFVLCNGVEISVYHTSNPNKPLLYFPLRELSEHWEDLSRVLSVSSFRSVSSVDYVPQNIDKRNFDYVKRPLLDSIVPKKQSAKRHYGVHGYFTRQSWNVVQEYIKNYTQPGDVVLDPFGGSGVTAIEAMMTRRKAINVDLNPMAVFLVEALAAPVDANALWDAYCEVEQEYTDNEPKTDKQIADAIKKYKGPKDLPLPKGSDVESVSQLFSDKQKAQLGLLKHIIQKQKDKNIRESLLLMFSGLVTKVNLTYHTSKFNEGNVGGGNAAPFLYYRYRVAKDPTAIDVLKYFKIRCKKVIAAKKDIEYFIDADTIDNLQIVRGTATDLSFIHRETVDYIYTDPPYGNKIPYLDLSVMWNAWLDLKVTDKDYEFEAIEGGTHNKTRDSYRKLMTQSIKEMYRVLKFDRWLSFVYSDKNPAYWHIIVETAEECGFEYVGTVSQRNGQTSFKKRQHPSTVLSGELIINFRKVRTPSSIMRANLGMNLSEVIMQTIEGIIAKYNGATLEQINDELIIKGLELGFLDLLKKEYSDLTPILMDNFDYDDKTDLFTIRKDSKFTTHIDTRLRIRYYLISYLRRMEREDKEAKFDDIVADILPLLKNGVTPEYQTILNVLEDVAYKLEDKDSWLLKKEGQQVIEYTD
jgi:DNA modification methylase